MAVPKRKKSKSKTRIRRQTKNISVPNLVQCPECKGYTPPHKVCLHCGFYKGKLIVQKKIKEKEKK